MDATHTHLLNTIFMFYVRVLSFVTLGSLPCFSSSHSNHGWSCRLDLHFPVKKTSEYNSSTPLFHDSYWLPLQRTYTRQNHRVLDKEEANDWLRNGTVNLNTVPPCVQKESTQWTKWPNNLFGRTYRENPAGFEVGRVLPVALAILEKEAGSLRTTRFGGPGIAGR